MNIIMATSRGEGLKKIYKGKPAIQLHVHKGSTLAFLTHTALRHIHKLKRDPQHRDTDIHIYFMAGICDITYKDELPHRRDWDAYTKKHHYEEVIFMESPHEASTRIKTQLLNAAHQISSAGAAPCFCTIPPCSISTWNHERLKQRKTTHLLHFRHYDDMQVNLQKAILDINRYIITLNIAHNMITPKIAVNIVKKSGAKRSHRYFYERLAVRGRWGPSGARHTARMGTNTDRNYGNKQGIHTKYSTTTLRRYTRDTGTGRTGT